MNKIKQNKWFWILQFLGWGLLVGTQVWAKLEFATETNKTYIFLEALLIFCSGFIISTLLRYYFKRNIKINEVKKINYLKLFSVYIISALLFSSMMFVAIPIYSRYHEKPMDVNNMLITSQIINSFLFFFFWTLLYFGIKIILKFNQNKVERLKLNSSLKESQLNTLKGQINPHFMFNSLNNIRGLMLEDVDKSREMITRLSEMLRYSLTKNNLDKIALSEEIEMIENYIELSKIQLEDRLIYKDKVAKNTLQIEIPPMLIQMLIENAIKHGISNLPKGGIVSLSIKKEKNKLHIEVKNTGKLTINETSTKVGLENIKKRLSLMYGEKAIFSLTEENDNVVAKINIPL
jgi:sensor histidine kinase YesM